MAKSYPITQPAYVYRLWDKNGVLLYVGMSAKSAHRRVGDHLSTKWWGAQIAHAEIVRYWSAREARAVEAEAIRTEKPRWNIDRGDTDADRKTWTEAEWRDHLVNLYRSGPGGKPSGYYPWAASEFERLFGHKAKPRKGRRGHIGAPVEYIAIKPIRAADVVAAGLEEDGYGR